MITTIIITARYRRGYSAEDHLISDGPLQDLIGREYKDAAAAEHAARSIAARQGYPERGIPITMTIEVAGHRLDISA